VVAGRADFTAEEWADLGSALISAAELVSFCDGGRSGMARELSRVRRTLNMPGADIPASSCASLPTSLATASSMRT
jgi:hypothetical protein